LLDWLRAEYGIENPSNKLLSVAELDSDTWARSKPEGGKWKAKARGVKKEGRGEQKDGKGKKEPLTDLPPSTKTRLAVTCLHKSF
jgi:hypothetical protein